MSVHNLEIDGGTLAVEIKGELKGELKGDGPLVVCSPGMGDTRDAYGPFADQLVAQGYRVATIDPRGHGDSSTKFKHYGDDATADDFIAVINKFGNGPAVLAGASYSAAAAVIAAGKQPSLVAGIILLGPFLRNGMGTIGLYIMPILFARPWGPYFWRYYAKTLWPGLGEERAKARAASSMASLTRPGRWSAFQKLVGSLDHRAVDPWVKKVKASVLVVMGDKDPDWSDPVKEAEWVASNFSKVDSVIVPGAGHAPQYESADLVSNEALKLLAKLRSEGAVK